jgi:ABC-2 type transport system ATP-binding protein
MRDGAIVATGTPSELIHAVEETEVRWVEDGREIVVRTTEPTRVLHEATARAVAAGVELEGLEVRRPTLEDVYLDLIGGDPTDGEDAA